MKFDSALDWKGMKFESVLKSSPADCHSQILLLNRYLINNLKFNFYLICLLDETCFETTDALSLRRYDLRPHVRWNVLLFPTVAANGVLLHSAVWDVIVILSPRKHRRSRARA